MSKIIPFKQKQRNTVGIDNNLIDEVSDMIIKHLKETETYPEMDEYRRRYIFEEIVNCVLNKR